jgi:uncharacterized membrane protein (DUF373 family)
MARAVGIDLGTTNSVIAAWENGAATVIPNAEGARTTPSVVAFTDSGERLVGQLARRQAILNPKDTIYSDKRFIGRKFDEVTEETRAVTFDVVPGPDGQPAATARRVMTASHRRRFDRIVAGLQTLEDGIHLGVALLLAVLAVALLVDVVDTVVHALAGPYYAVDVVLSVLDNTLVLFIVAELLHTVRITVTDQHLRAEPFLIVGLIAGVRRVLLVTAESERSFRWNPEGIELLILIALIFVMALAILVVRRWPAAEEQVS